MWDILNPECQVVDKSGENPADLWINPQTALTNIQIDTNLQIINNTYIRNDPYICTTANEVSANVYW